MKLKELWCVLFGHDVERHGAPCGGQDLMWPEYDEWWECRRCGDLSTLYDWCTFMGRLKSWWYQE